MTLLRLFRLQLFRFDVFVEIRICSDIRIDFIEDIFINSSDINAFERQFLFYEFQVFVQLARFVMVRRLAFIAVIIFFTVLRSRPYIRASSEKFGFIPFKPSILSWIDNAVFTFITSVNSLAHIL